MPPCSGLEHILISYVYVISIDQWYLLIDHFFEAMELRDYQHDIIAQTKAAMAAGEKRLLIVAPTGSGKTVLVAHMLKSAAAKGNRSWFIVHRRELVKQSIRTFHDVDVQHGVIANGFPPTYGSQIQLASIQTLKNRFGKSRSPKIIIIDEGHHAVAGSWKKLFDNYPNAFFVLVTATPERLDGKGLGGYANQIIEGPSVAELIKAGWLCNYRAFAPSTIDTSGIKKSMGDFQRGALALAADKPTITGDAIKEYQKLCPGKRAIAFCTSVAHSKHVCEAFNSAGIPAEHVDGETDHGQRDQAIKNFRDGKTRVLTNVELFGEGFDLPVVETAILLRPTQSLALHLQQIGRVLRPAPGKSEALILDHAGNLARHGLPDEPRCWDLGGKRERIKKERDGEIKVRTCRACFAVQLASRRYCQFCKAGLISEAEREVEIREGELAEIRADEQRAKWAARKDQGRAQTLEELVALGKKRGYKRPHFWAKHVFNARQRKKING